MSISRGIYSEDLSQTRRNKNRHLKRKKKNSNIPDFGGAINGVHFYKVLKNPWPGHRFITNTLTSSTSLTPAILAKGVTGLFQHVSESQDLDIEENKRK